MVSLLAGLLLLGGCHLLVPLDDLQRESPKDTQNAGGAGGTGLTTPECATEPIAVTRELFVAPDGDDGADGSAARPWRSVSRAVTAATAGDVIRVAEGEFLEAGAVVVPTGVSLVGAGTAQTRLSVVAGDTILRLSESSDLTISKLTLDGRSRATPEGIHIAGGSAITIAEVGFIDLSRSGLRVTDGFAQVSELHVCRSSFVRCAADDPGNLPYEDTGCIHADPLADSVFSELTINEPIGAGIRIDAASAASSENLLFHELDIRVPPVRDAIGAPQYALTLRGARLRAVEIRGSRFNNPVALWQPAGEGDTAPGVRLHHNTFTPQTAAIDLDASGIEVDHNYFSGGYYALMNLNDSPPNQGLLVHHNVFAHQTPPYLLAWWKNELSGLVFANNTVHVGTEGEAAPLFRFEGGGSNHQYINDVFWLDTPEASNPLGFPPGSTVRNNLFSPVVPAEYPDNQGGMPDFLGTAPAPDPYYVPAPGSPLLSAGAAVPEIGLAVPADIGACSATVGACLAP